MSERTNEVNERTLERTLERTNEQTNNGKTGRRPTLYSHSLHTSFAASNVPSTASFCATTTLSPSLHRCGYFTKRFATAQNCGIHHCTFRSKVRLLVPKLVRSFVHFVRSFVHFVRSFTSFVRSLRSFVHFVCSFTLFVRSFTSFVRSSVRALRSFR